MSTGIETEPDPGQGPRDSHGQDPGQETGEPASQPFWRDEMLTRAQCRSAKVLRLSEYWDALRRGRSMPSRRDIDPTELGPLLSHIHLSEWHSSPERVRYRLAGTELVAAIGREISGRWLEEFHTDPADLMETMGLYRHVIGERAPVFGRTSGTLLRVGVHAFEWVLCPLSDDGLVVTHFIGLEDYVSQRRYLGAGS